MKTLSDDALTEVAAFLKATAELTRLKILRTLQDGEKTVGAITVAAACGQPNASKHLAVLVRAHIVTSRRRGTSVYYRIRDPNITAICSTVCRSIARRMRDERHTLRSLEGGRGAR